MSRKCSKASWLIVWFWNKFMNLLDFACAFLEMHLVKAVSLAIMALCCSMVNALHLAVVITLLLCLLFGISGLRISFCFIGPFLSILFLCKMLYQTKFVPEMSEYVNCSEVNITVHSILQHTILDPEWWGFIILKPGQTLVSTYKSYIIVFAIMTLQTVIKTRQKIIRIDAGESPKVPYVLFQETTRQDADKNLTECLKFLINYGFYKFGVEVTLSYCVFVIAFRMDLFSVLYAIWVAILFLPERLTLSMIWPCFMITMVFSIVWQYAMAVGLSKKTCFHYPWSGQTILVSWMFLPSFTRPPNTAKIMVDFVLLLLIQRQQAVFDLERKYGERYAGGSNKETYLNRDPVNPTPDHTDSIRSWLDVVKFLFMRCLFRITLAFQFWTGASNANILSLGYLVGAFLFLWIYYDLCLWNIRKILKWWNILLGYTVAVIFLKAVFELAGCFYSDFLTQKAFWLVELLFLHCSTFSGRDHTGYYKKNSNFYWDVVCFTLAIFQRRYFQSHYFLHEIDDVMAVNKLQAKGAKLMDELQENKLKEFQLRERKTLSKIKKNMNRIKAWQKRMQGLNYNEPTDHATAIYMGDYLMFDNLEEMSGSVDETTSSSSDDYEDEDYKGVRNPTMSEFMGTVFKKTEDSYSRLDNNLEGKAYKARGMKTDGKDRDKAETGPSGARKEGNQDKGKEKRVRVPKEPTEETDDPEAKNKIKTAWNLFRSFLDSVMVSMIRFFNKNSKDYCYIESRMKEEKKLQKRMRKAFSHDQRHDASDSPRSLERSSASAGEVKRLAMKSQDSRQASGYYWVASLANDYFSEPPKKFSQALLVNLINSICMFVMSQTELFCYIITFLHTVLSPTLLSLPLPFFVFMWGSLTTIRPTTTFWTVLIAYTEVTVVIKALFQNSIFPWNVKNHRIRPEYPPLFLGIHRNHQYVIADLFLLLSLFLHRYKLKTLGLWNRTHEVETLPPQNLRVYKELPSEEAFKDVKGNRSLLHQRKRLNSEMTNPKDSIFHFVQMATWKCTSRVTAKVIYWGQKVRTSIRVKEIEGPILVTHDGRRLEPTSMYVSQVPEESLEGTVVLRVYTQDVPLESKKFIYRLSWIQYFTPVRKFFLQIVVRDWRVSADFYTLMFIFEFLNFLIVFFGYPAFTEHYVDEDQFSLAENQVPFLYLITVISHFFVIIIDRMLYLRKSVIGKMIFQVVLIILVHIWMFILIPRVTESPFNKLYVPQTYYIISCFYFLMSAYQLRVGYPMRVQGHFLCKKYGYVNYYAYIGLQFIPFFNQLRTVLDFLCIKSSLTMMEWIKMESIFELVFANKCSRRADIYYPAARGKECPKCAKYSPGVAVLIGIIIAIWLPFIAFALFNTVAQSNLPQQATLDVQIEQFGIIYVSRSSFTEIVTLTESQYKFMQSVYKDNKKVWTFLSRFSEKDVAVLRFRFEPHQPWMITSLDMTSLNETVQDLSVPITFYINWVIDRNPRAQIIWTANGYNKVILNKYSDSRRELAQAFLGHKTLVRLNHLLPKFVHVTNEGRAKPVKGFLGSSNGSELYRNVTLALEGDGRNMWWKLVELADDPEESEISKLPFQSSKQITIYTFNEKNIPKVLINITKKGIIGLYLSTIFVIWTCVKRIMWRYPYLMFSEMPNPDPVLKLCHDIYLARESHDFALEEDLFAKLLFLFRSPETMVKVTKLTSPPHGST